MSNTFKCPNCGAPIHSGICPYCGTQFTFQYYDIVIDKLTDEQMQKRLQSAQSELQATQLQSAQSELQATQLQSAQAELQTTQFQLAQSELQAAQLQSVQAYQTNELLNGLHIRNLWND